MSKRKQVRQGLQNRSQESLDNMMYGEGETGFEDDFLANIDDSNQQVYEENEKLRAELAQLQEQLDNSSKQLMRGSELQLGNFTVTPTRLVIPKDAAEEELAEIGRVLFRLEGSLQWLIGDWLVGVDKLSWGKTEEIAQLFGRRVKTLYDYKHVAKKVKFSVRTENLSFQHHALVSSMDREKQKKYLEMAEYGDEDPSDPEKRIPWTVAKLRAKILEDRARSLPAGAQDKLDITGSVRAVRDIFKVVRDGAENVSARKRKEHLQKIELIRRLLNDAEEKLRDQDTLR